MKKRIISIAALLLCASMTLSLTGCGEAKKYETASALADSGDYEAARAAFAELGDYEDAADRVTECDYETAKEALDAEEYEKAEEMFTSLGDYEDCADLLTETRYLHAIKLYEDGEYEQADAIFTEMLDYKDSYHYDLLSYIKYDASAFADEFYAAIAEVFEKNGYPVKLYEATGSHNGGQRSYFVIPIEDEAPDINKYFVQIVLSAVKEDGKPLSDGSVNHISVFCTCFSGDDDSSNTDMLTIQLISSAIVTQLLTGDTDTEALTNEISENLFDILRGLKVGDSDKLTDEYKGFERTFYMGISNIQGMSERTLSASYSLDIPELIGDN